MPEWWHGVRSGGSAGVWARWGCWPPAAARGRVRGGGHRHPTSADDTPFPTRVADMASPDRGRGRRSATSQAVLSCLPVPPQPRSRRGRARAGAALLRPHRGRGHHEGDHRDERHGQGCHGAPVRAGARLRGHRRCVADRQRSTSAARCACGSGRCRRTPPACSATRSTGRPRAW